MDSRQQFVVHEHRPHGNACPSFDLIDRSDEPGKQHKGTIFHSAEAQAIAELLSEHADEYARRLNTLADDEMRPF